MCRHLVIAPGVIVSFVVVMVVVRWWCGGGGGGSDDVSRTDAVESDLRGVAHNVEQTLACLNRLLPALHTVHQQVRLYDQWEACDGQDAMCTTRPV